MSKQLTVPPIIRPFRGFAEPALPNGYWHVHTSVLGDASGGLQSVNIRFSSANEPNPSTLWNLEQLVANHSGTSVVLRLDFGNMDFLPFAPSDGALTIQYQAALVPSLLGNVLNLDAIQLPIFLGAARKEVNGDLAFDATNENGSSLNIYAQGFFWGPEAVNAAGGPQRPSTGLYGV